MDKIAILKTAAEVVVKMSVSSVVGIVIKNAMKPDLKLVRKLNSAIVSSGLGTEVTERVLDTVRTTMVPELKFPQRFGIIIGSSVIAGVASGVAWKHVEEQIDSVVAVGNAAQSSVENLKQTLKKAKDDTTAAASDVKDAAADVVDDVADGIDNETKKKD